MGSTSFDVTKWISDFANATTSAEVYSLSITFNNNIPAKSATLLTALQESPDTSKFTDTLAKHIDLTSHALLLIYPPEESAKLANILISKNKGAAAAIIAPIFYAFPSKAISLVDSMILQFPDNAIILSETMAKTHPNDAARLISEVTTIKGKQYTQNLLLEISKKNLKAAESVAKALLKHKYALGKELLNELIKEKTTPTPSSSLFITLLNQTNGNIFAGNLGSFYITIGNTLLFTTETIAALINHTALPSSIVVNWAPTGLPAQQLLKNLERSYTVFNADNKAIYTFVNVYYSNNVTSGTGWLCTWAADGVAPVSFA